MAVIKVCTGSYVQQFVNHYSTNTRKRKPVICKSTVTDVNEGISIPYRTSCFGKTRHRSLTKTSLISNRLENIAYVVRECFAIGTLTDLIQQCFYETAALAVRQYRCER